jgi:hypothetical protein
MSVDTSPDKSDTPPTLPSRNAGSEDSLVDDVEVTFGDNGIAASLEDTCAVE